MRILVIADISPYPLTSGDRIREYNLIRRIADHHQVWLAVILENPSDEDGIKHLSSFCAGIEYAYIQRHHPLYHIPGLIKFGLSGKPLELKFRQSAELAEKVKRLTRENEFDVVMIINSHTALYLDMLPASTNTKSILMLENIEFAQYESLFKIEKNPLNKIRGWINWRMMQRWEPSYAEKFDRCITVSEIDKAIFKSANPRLSIDVIPNGVDVHQYQMLSAAPDAHSLLFIGKMSYTPCSDAAVYFCREILPFIQKSQENTELWIVGREPPQEVLDLNNEKVHVTGWVEDVVPYYQRSRICIVPLRAGGGTRLKILEAMALGRPVVATTIGCEGLNVTDGENIMIADQPEDFARKILLLLNNEDLCRTITHNARRLVEEQYDWDILSDRLLKIFAEVHPCV